MKEHPVTFQASPCHIITMRNFLRFRKWARKHLYTPLGKFLLVAGLFILFFVVFFIAYPKIGLPITTLGIIPILAGAWIYGMWAGILLTIALYSIDILIITLMGWGDFRIALLTTNLLGLATSAAVSMIMGRLAERVKRSQEEFRQNKLLLEERNASARIPQPAERYFAGSHGNRRYVFHAKSAGNPHGGTFPN